MRHVIMVIILMSWLTIVLRMSTQLLNKEKEVIFESDDVTEVIDKVKELFGQCERNMINNNIKSGLNFEYFIC